MVFPENCQIIKGYFPDTAKYLNPNETYAFVSLDCDLYNPILAGVQYFYPRMEKHGVIFVHDYYSALEGFNGVKKAIHLFLQENKDASILPVGDHCSVMIVKN